MSAPGAELKSVNCGCVNLTDTRSRSRRPERFGLPRGIIRNQVSFLLKRFSLTKETKATE